MVFVFLTERPVMMALSRIAIDVSDIGSTLFSCCVIVMVVNEFNEIALLRQSYISDEYQTFVAGFMTPGETAEQAAVREVKEELGLDVGKLVYAGTHWLQNESSLCTLLSVMSGDLISVSRLR